MKSRAPAEMLAALRPLPYMEHVDAAPGSAAIAAAALRVAFCCRPC